MISEVITDDTITSTSCLKITVHWTSTNIARSIVTCSTVITT